MLYSNSSHNASTQRIQTTSRPTKVRRVTGATVMALGLPVSSTNIGRNQRNNDAKFATSPHRRSKVMVKQTRKRNYRQLGRSHKTIYTQLQVNIQVTSIHRGSQSLRATTRGNAKSVYPKMESHQKLSGRSVR
jgi:hypothetical protein